MAKTIKQGNTIIYKFSKTDKKDLGVSFNYAVRQGNKIKGFKKISGVNKALGIPQKAGFKSSSFNKKK